MESMLAENLQGVRERIVAAARQSGRAAQDVKLVAVSKTKPVELINEAIALGVQCIGENRVQELLEKLPSLAPVEVHLIGSLQSNKARQVVGKVALIHSLDRLSLAEEIDRRAKAQNIVCRCLVQVNIGEEAQKGGVHPDELLPFFEALRGFPAIRVEGLMCVPPLGSADESARYFEKTRRLQERINEQMLAPQILTELSMGMSGDYEEAIRQGATMVRIGSAIFGKRVNQN